MLLARAWRPKFARISSTLVGHSGRAYVRDKLLQAHPKKPELNIYLAHCEGEPYAYILKPVSQSIFELSQELKHEFGFSRRIRTHVDQNDEERVLVYDYFMDNLLRLIRNTAGLPVPARKHILQEVGLGLKDMHDKHWIHLDVKPDNIMLNWCLDKNHQYRIGRVVLSDLDCALKLEGEKLLNHRMGNVMWRSPEGQTGMGIGKPSEVFSFGLLSLFTITGAETLHPDFEQLEKNGTEPEHLLLYKLLSMFGPVPPELIAHVKDDHWREMLTELSQVVAAEDPGLRLQQWDENFLPNLNPEAKRLIGRMTNLDPGARATMAQIMEEPWWK